MKYRILDSVAHNFTHSFVSLMNYVDDGYVIDDLLQVAREAKGKRISIQYMMTPISIVLPLIRENKLVALGVTTKRRSKLLPDVPTIAEAGINNFDFPFGMESGFRLVLQVPW